MRVFEIQGGFGMERLVAGERPDPRPGRGQILLRMKAASLNYRDLLTVTGKYNPKQPLPLIPCSDGVGEVIEVGEAVGRVAAGDRVATLFAQKWWSGRPEQEKLRSTLGGPYDGTLAEYMVLDENGVVPVPAHLTDAEAATLPCAALTAWSALVTLGEVRPGDTVLVQGTGGVSIFALQMATILGARVVVTSSKAEKLEKALALGAWAGINYVEEPEWGKKARQLTGGAGVDHVVEVGGAGTLEQSLKAVRIGGRISMIGVLSGGRAEIALTSVVMSYVRIQGLLVGSREGFEAMNRAIAQHELRPVVDRVFLFDETPEAFRYMAEGRHFGKVAIALG
jgi:NADPH:quinone reductase-like Zn-dependent oxidoreductase